MKLSIIIPVYRVEDTLNRCIESVLNQNLTDFEVILVDDGSPDHCPQKCDDWAHKDSHIRVIHKPNGGLSDARNAGIDIAQGDYLTFVDSDDYIAEDTYLPLMNTLYERPDIDILEFPVFVHYGSPNQHLLSFNNEAEYSDMDEYWYVGKAYQHSYACNKIYKASLFDSIRFPKGVVFEDIHTLPLLLKRTQVVATKNVGLYYYCTNPSSITVTADGQALKMLLEPHVKIVNDSHKETPDFQDYYLHVLNIQMDVYELTGEGPILPKRRVSPFNFKGIQALKAIMLNLLGVNKLCKLNKFIHKITRGR